MSHMSKAASWDALHPICVHTFCRAHLHREQAGEVVFPVVSSGNDNPLLHGVVLDGAYRRPHIEICYRTEYTQDYKIRRDILDIRRFVAFLCDPLVDGLSSNIWINSVASVFVVIHLNSHPAGPSSSSSPLCWSSRSCRSTCPAWSKNITPWSCEECDVLCLRSAM